jgi:chemotaxis protein histidine kinase CheA
MGRQASERRELRALRQAFGRQLADRVRAIEKALEDTLVAVPVDRDRADIVFQLTHRLCGAASIYGYSDVHEAATALECVAEALRDSPPASAHAHAAHARRVIETLKRAAGLAVGASHRIQEAGETVP